jgi:hypothetical protein
VSYNSQRDEYVIKFIVKEEGGGQQIVEQTLPSADVDGSSSFSVLRYFKDRKIRLKAWFAASKILVLFQPSSAAAERVFSLLEAVFPKGGRRGHALADLINGTLKLNMHKRDL